MSTLYSLTEEYQELMSMALDPDVDPEALADTLEGIEGEIENKADGYAKVMRNLDADASAIKEEIARLTERKKRIEANVDRMKKSLETAMRLTGKTKFKTSLFSFNIQKNPAALKIDNPDRVPEEFLIPQDPKINTTAIKRELKEGTVFDWCHLEQGESLRIK
jgi:predicted ribosome quality control (RQC) complex YloA/Tae2 family protein